MPNRMVRTARENKPLLEMVLHPLPSGDSSGGRNRAMQEDWSMELGALWEVWCGTLSWMGTCFVSNRCLFETQCHASPWETRGAFVDSRNAALSWDGLSFQVTNKHDACFWNRNRMLV